MGLVNGVTYAEETSRFDKRYENPLAQLAERVFGVVQGLTLNNKLEATAAAGYWSEDRYRRRCQQFCCSQKT